MTTIERHDRESERHGDTLILIVSIHRNMEMHRGDDVDRVVLTKRREELIMMGYNNSDPADRSAMSRLRGSSETALWELTRIADSNEIDQTEVFDPEQVAELIRTLLNPNPKQEHIDIGTAELARASPHNKYTEDDFTDEFQAYRDKLKLELSKIVLDEPGDE